MPDPDPGEAAEGKKKCAGAEARGNGRWFLTMRILA
jgi:hypothetical protein